MLPWDNASTKLPIASLSPGVDDTVSKYIEAVVTLVWPYSSSERTFSLLLAAHDFRLRATKGQVRTNFAGPSAAELAKTHVGIGDTIRLSLKGCKWVQNVQDVTTPGKRIDWDLLYNTTLNAEIHSSTGLSRRVDIDLSAILGNSSPHLLNDHDSQTTTERVNRAHPLNNIDSWASPVFLQGRRVSSGPFTDIVSNLFGDGDGFFPGRGRKRTKFARESGSWRFMSRTPSPTKNGLDHDSSLGTEDEQLQEKDSVFGDDHATGDRDGSETRQSFSSSHKVIRSYESAEHSDVEGLAGEMEIEAETHSPGRATPKFAPSEEMAPPSTRAKRQEQSPQRNLQALTPRLEPLASPGLPLVSPLVKQTSFFAGGYFPPQMTEPSELDASAQLDSAHLQNNVSPKSAISTPSLSPQEIEENDQPRIRDSRLRKIPATDLVSHPSIMAESYDKSPSIGDSHEDMGRPTDFAPSQAMKHAQVETSTISNFESLKGHFTLQSLTSLIPTSLEDYQTLIDTVNPTPNPSFPRAATITNERLSLRSDSSSGNVDVIEKVTSRDESLTSRPYDEEEHNLPSATLLPGYSTLDSSRDGTILSELTAMQSQSDKEDLGEDSIELELRGFREGRAQSPSAGNSQVGRRPTTIDMEFDHDEKRATPLGPIHKLEIEQSPVSPSITASPTIESANLLMQGGRYADNSDYRARTPARSNTESKSQDGEDELEAEEKIEEETIVRDVILEEPEGTFSADVNTAFEDVRPTGSGPENIQSVALGNAEMNTLDTKFGDDSIQVMPGINASRLNVRPMTPNGTQEPLQMSALPEASILPPEGLITPDRSQTQAETPDTLITAQEITATKSPEPKPTMRRRSSRISQRLPGIDTPQISSPWFTPRHANKIKRVEREPDLSVRKGSLEAEAAPTSSTFGTGERFIKSLPTESLAKGFRTTKAYFPTLASLSSYFNQTVDIIASATSQSVSPKRASSGPRDQYTSLRVTDPTMRGTDIMVQIFRPYKSVLPSARRGEIVLLRNFKVQSRFGKMELLSTDTSGWAVFHPSRSFEQLNNNPTIGNVTITGPPVEYGPEEVSRGDGLATWWQEEGSDLFSEATNSGMRITRSNRKLDSTERAATEGKDGIPPLELGRRSKVLEPSNLGPTILHELRDGTKYFDPLPGSSSSSVAHELRDGTKWFDNLARGNPESRPGSRE